MKSEGWTDVYNVIEKCVNTHILYIQKIISDNMTSKKTEYNVYSIDFFYAFSAVLTGSLSKPRN